MNKIIIPVLASILILGTLGLSQDVYADFEIIDLGLLEDDIQNFPGDINDSGEITGNSARPNNLSGYHWKNGVLTDIGTLGSITNVGDINEAGQIVGESQPSDRGGSAISWDLENGLQDLGQDLVEFPGATNSAARVINDFGVIAGSVSLPFRIRAVMWHPDPVIGIQDLGDIGNNPTVVLSTDINNAGQIVGTYRTANIQNVFFWENGEMTVVGESRSTPKINEAGKVIFKPISGNGVIWDNTNEPVDLGNIGIPGTTSPLLLMMRDKL